MPGWDLAHAQDDVIPYILRMLEDTFSLVAARISFSALLITTPIFHYAVFRLHQYTVRVSLEN